MHGTIFKSSNGEYMSVLSDDSIDREDEIIGKSFFEDSINRKDRIRMMMNHENDVLKRIGDWTNQKIMKVNGHNALVAKPKFFMSNPNAKIIKGMLDDGAELDLSIGALPSDSEDREIEGKSYLAYTKGEILEASYVGIGANKNSTSLRIAKSLGLIDKKDNSDLEQNNVGGLKVKKEEIEEMLKAQSEELTKTFDDKISDIKKELEEVVEPEPEPAPAEPEPEAAPEPSDAEKALKLEVKDLEAKNKELETKYKAIQSEPGDEEKKEKGLPVMRLEK